MSTVSWRANFICTVGVALVASSLSLAFGASGAQAAPKGDNGTVKIHNSATAVTDPRDEPHVCVFYLDAFGFDPGQSVSWQIKSWPPTGDRTVVDQGTLTLGSTGDGRTSDQSLPNGHYKLFWTFTGEHGAKQKVFWVSCPSSTPTSSSATPTPTCTCQTPTPTPTSSSPLSSSPSPSPTSSIAPAPAPTPVQGTLPVTG